MGVIEIKHLTRDYGHGKGVFDVSFDVNRGEVFGFLGPNGAGKTTTIRHLVGFIKNQSGTCMINGHDCWKESAYINKHLGYIPGEMALFDDMTGHGFLSFMARYRGRVDMRRQQELIELFELNPQGKIKKMSKGMKQKLGIVSAFMHNPDILILDEPTSGLDPLMQKHFIELIAKEKEKGKTILLSSHIFEEVERTCDRVGIIRQGKMVTVDSIEILRKRHMHQYTVTLPSNQEAEAFARDFDGIAEGNKVHVTSTSSLEHIFMDYYQGDQ
ncbi:ABC-2 type transport system ATP-binding protein [Sharpea azabuensis]|uniref:ABC transporter ATP-binding protein n=1 Tax=Sharpea azabuensis TaxID=322505 RepID=UPI0008F0F5E3|nr:ABC transporter ATP-binding protein [Sharpea azabuensis]SFD96543.1 ABC-2 type transport system ATP-binding protein [Sharpea azabuensis]SFK90440.1 ABC-2 type transport system ATP-binding protein [Sharpea azabuensis]